LRSYKLTWQPGGLPGRAAGRAGAGPRALGSAGKITESQNHRMVGNHRINSTLLQPARRLSSAAERIKAPVQQDGSARPTLGAPGHGTDFPFCAGKRRDQTRGAAGSQPESLRSLLRCRECRCWKAPSQRDGRGCLLGSAAPAAHFTLLWCHSGAPKRSTNINCN